MAEEIIAAVATAWGEGGISIVRVSGKGSAELVEKVFHSKRPFSEQQARYMALGSLKGADGIPFDEALAVRFEEGKSYTGEESAEIHCHGGLLSAQRCVEELCANGARIALPGEFTRRAFICGRIDLPQAEAVLGIIRARSDEALAASARSLQGGFTEKIKNFLAELTSFAAALEVDLDFPEEGEGYIGEAAKEKRMDALCAQCASLCAACRSGMLLREGVRAAIIGRPNVGKSSLLNALLGEERAIVTSRPGTTRDSIEETFIYKGLPVRIIDTAGIRNASDEAEAMGIERSKRAMKEADIVLWVFDASAPLAEENEEKALWESLQGKRLILVLNKSDLPQVLTTETLSRHFSNIRTVSISAAEGSGIEELRGEIYGAFSSGTPLSGGYGVSARQAETLNRAASALSAARSALRESLGSDTVISAVAEARAELAELLGIDACEDLLDKVFSEFCVGK